MQCLRVLLHAKADINWFGRAVWPPCVCVCLHPHYTLLLVNSTDQSGATACFVAATFNHTTTLRLVDSSCFVAFWNSQKIFWHRSVLAGKLVLSSVVHVHILPCPHLFVYPVFNPCIQLRQILMTAFHQSRAFLCAVFRWLIHNGADCSRPNELGLRPFEVAKSRGHDEAVSGGSGGRRSNMEEILHVCHLDQTWH